MANLLASFCAILRQAPRRERRLLFTAAFFLFVALLAFVCFIKPAVLVRVFWDNALAGVAAVSGLWTGRLLIALPLAAFWVFVLMMIPPAALFSLAGLGSFLVMGCSAIGLATGPAPTLVFLSLPFWTYAGMKLYRSRTSSTPVAVRQVEASRGVARRVAIVVTALFSLQVLNDVAFAMFFRGPAMGDELHFWWSSFRKLHELGFTRYLREFEVSSYIPGYPLLANLFTAFVPERWMGSADAALPLIFGFLLYWIMAAGVRRRWPSVTESAFLAAVFSLLFFSDSWVRTMVMRSWYGEAMAVLVTAAVLLELSRPRRGEGVVAEMLFAFGLGYFARISKAPLAMVLLPAVVPCFFASALWFRDNGWKARVRRVLALAAGAACAQLLWAHSLETIAQPDRYSFTFESLLHPDFANLRHHVLPFVWVYYKKQFLVPFALLSIMGLALRPRQHLAAFASSLAMIASVLLLYSTYWKAMEHESAMRYLLHGIYAWIVYIVAMHYPLFTRLMRRCFRLACSVAFKNGRRA